MDLKPFFRSLSFTLVFTVPVQAAYQLPVAEISPDPILLNKKLDCTSPWKNLSIAIERSEHAAATKDAVVGLSKLGTLPAEKITPSARVELKQKLQPIETCRRISPQKLSI